MALIWENKREQKQPCVRVQLCTSSAEPRNKDRLIASARLLENHVFHRAISEEVFSTFQHISVGAFAILGSRCHGLGIP